MRYPLMIGSGHILFLGMLAGCANAQSPGAHEERATTAQEVKQGPTRPESAETAAAGRYIVIFKESYFSQGNDSIKKEAETRTLSELLARKYRAEIITTWTHALHGMSVVMSAESALEMAGDPDVLEVKADQPVQLDQ